MTLFKQLALVVSMIIIVMLGAVMYLNYTSAKQNMIDSLYESTVNNISTLSSKIADAKGHEALIMTTIDSEFDGGYYMLIEFISNDGIFHYKQVDDDVLEGIPSWFIKYTEVETVEITSDVSSGWEILGEVTVMGDTGIIYNALYKMFVKLLYLFVVLVFIALIVLSILLHFVLKPLKQIQNQAEAILKNEFVIQEKEPYTTEFKEVVNGMNSMVKKVEDIFVKANESAKRNRELLYTEPITKLFNRRYLMLKLPDLIAQNNKINGGTVLLVGLSSIEVMNQLISRRNTNNLILSLSEVFDTVTQSFDDRLLCRLNETEFLLILPEYEVNQKSDVEGQINRAFIKLLTQNKISENSVHMNIGLYRYNNGVSMAELLTRSDTALSNAIADERSNICLFEEEDTQNTLAKEQWRTIIENAIQENSFTFESSDVVNTKTNIVVHKSLVYNIYGSDAREYLYKDFIAPVINLGHSVSMHIAVIKELITQETEFMGEHCTLKLPNDFFRDEGALEVLENLFHQYQKNNDMQLSFEIADSFIIKNLQLVKSFINIFNKYGYSFSIHSFSGESNDYAYLKELNPSFIKADSAFLLDQSSESMNALLLITDSLGIKLIATLLTKKENIKTLQSLHIEMIQQEPTSV
ncbi:EAL domain-containing protein [Sulfurimonas sp. SAG-AH-194-C21]|nr:LapD/MoxY N-terminal periplasmic domain-containing protein [Sulfurimonas sp. SAG-AH-194-C21]MDF1884043.1 EAL domain-containing protein [Sulfurimonas sp. SAG-AH-194-C21]